MTQPWASGPLVGLDFESTSPEPLEARVVQAALLVVEPDGQLGPESTCFTVNPLVEIPAEASAIHGLTADKVALSCRTSTMVDTLVLRMEELGVAEGRIPLVIFNATYDLVLLHSEAARCGRSIDFRPMILDPRVIDLKGARYRSGKRKLADVAATYGVELVGAHGAKADALAAVRIMRAMLALWPRFGTATLERLQELQSTWYLAWRDHINEWWASEGKSDHITGTWPYGNMAPPVAEQVGVA